MPRQFGAGESAAHRTYRASLARGNGASAVKRGKRLFLCVISSRALLKDFRRAPLAYSNSQESTLLAVHYTLELTPSSRSGHPLDSPIPSKNRRNSVPEDILI